MFLSQINTHENAPFILLWFAVFPICEFVILVCYIVYDSAMKVYQNRGKPSLDYTKGEARKQVLKLINSGENDHLIQHLIDMRCQQIVDDPKKFTRKWYFSKVEKL
jgi:hypothetical protein